MYNFFQRIYNIIKLWKSNNIFFIRITVYAYDNRNPSHYNYLNIISRRNKCIILQICALFMVIDV